MAIDKILEALDGALPGLPKEVHFEIRGEDGKDVLYIVGKENADGYRAEYVVGTIDLDAGEYELADSVTSSAPLGYIIAKDVLPRLGFTQNE